MHKFNLDILSATDYMAETTKGLHADNREFVEQNEAVLQEAYANYLAHTVPCTLEQLEPIWPQTGGRTPSEKEQNAKCQKVHDLYESKRAFRNKHWHEIEKENGGRILRCPICGVEKCAHLDHYVPREEMPEFSVFAPNLIPLCYDCNEKKKAIWKDARGERVIINAYYDDLPNKPICECVISIDENGLPKAEIIKGTQLDDAIAADRLVLSTIDSLELIPRIWQPECNLVFDNEVVRLVEDYDAERWPNPEDYWVYKSQRIPNYLKDSVHSSFIARIVYESIVTSEVMKNWLCNYLRAI